MHTLLTHVDARGSIDNTLLSGDENATKERNETEIGEQRTAAFRAEGKMLALRENKTICDDESEDHFRYVKIKLL